MKTVTVLATFEARPGRETELKKVLQALLAPTRQEAGCVNYDLHISPGSPAKFMFHENWTSKEHLDAHAKSAHLAALHARVDELCIAAPTITLWDKIG